MKFNVNEVQLKILIMCATFKRKTWHVLIFIKFMHRMGLIDDRNYTNSVRIININEISLFCRLKCLG